MWGESCEGGRRRKEKNFSGDKFQRKIFSGLFLKKSRLIFQLCKPDMRATSSFKQSEDIQLEGEKSDGSGYFNWFVDRPEARLPDIALRKAPRKNMRGKQADVLIDLLKHLSSRYQRKVQKHRGRRWQHRAPSDDASTMKIITSTGS